MRNIFLGLIVLGCLYSCTDEVTIPSSFENPELVVDAWLTTEDKPQEIRITYTQDFIDTTDYKVNNDADIRISNVTQNRIYNFQSIGNGAYRYDEGNIANVGDSLVLNVNVDNKELLSSTKVNRTAKIDSINLELITGEVGLEDGIYAQLYATDAPGVGDTYWVRTYKNDTLLNKAAELNLVYDSTFNGGTGLDGVQFIRPIRSAVNATNDEGRQVPYQEGDEIRCEIHSLSNHAFYFLQIAQEQAQNGDNSIFAIPVYNASGNIVSEDSNVLGVFNVSEVATEAKEIKL